MRKRERERATERERENLAIYTIRGLPTKIFMSLKVLERERESLLIVT